MDTLSKDNFEGSLNKSNITSEEAYYDTVFKSLAKYKFIAATLLHTAVDDFRKYTVDDIVKGIKDINKRNYINDFELYTSEIDVLNLESQDSKQDKKIIYDLVFYLELEGNNSIVKLTVDLEMQKDKPKYDVVNRAMYYAASLLRGTITNSANNYNNIHKVYSIWFCRDNIIEDKLGLADSYYRHTYRMMRHYRNCEKYNSNISIIDKNADLMEVVFIELKKQNELKDSDIEELNEALEAMFTNSKIFIDKIKDKFKVEYSDNNRMVEEAKKMYSTEEIRDMAFTEGIEKGIKQGIEQGIEKGMKKGIEQGVEKGKLDLARQLYNDGIDLKYIMSITEFNAEQIIGSN